MGQVGIPVVTVEPEVPRRHDRVSNATGNDQLEAERRRDPSSECYSGDPDECGRTEPCEPMRLKLIGALLELVVSGVPPQVHGSSGDRDGGSRPEGDERVALRRGQGPGTVRRQGTVTRSASLTLARGEWP